MWYNLQNGEGLLHPEGKRRGAVLETGEELGVSLNPGWNVGKAAY